MNYAIKGMQNTDIHDNVFHMRLAGDWLLAAQEAGGGGYAHSYHLLKGWMPPYPETTGYIIPSMLALSKKLVDEKYTKSAKRAGEWLLSIQYDDGAFSDLMGMKQVFDTGQIIYGLLGLHGETAEEKWLDAAVNAGKWLVKNQENDGSWVKAAYNNMPHAYYSRVGAILVRLGKETGKKEFEVAGLRNLAWTLSQQTENGYFWKMGFKKDELPYTHTIMYVLEGLLFGWKLTKNKEFLDAVIRTGERLRQINENRDFILLSKYDKEWGAATNQKCITGLAQWCWIALELYHITKNRGYLEQAVKTAFYIKSKQILKGSKNVLGALPSSVPVWGNYGKFCFFNWNMKFFIDALLSLDTLNMPFWREEETYVAESFRFNRNRFYKPDEKADNSIYVKEILEMLPAAAEGVFADIGCGRGAILNDLKSKRGSLKYIGIDPIFEGEDILKGSIYSAPLKDDSVDFLLAKEVLQHVGHLDLAVDEMKRIMKNRGTLMVIERNPLSGLGVRKGVCETLGRWMYPWDSPLREKWYTETEWKKILERFGEIKKVVKINHPSGRKELRGWDNRFFFFAVEVHK